MEEKDYWEQIPIWNGRSPKKSFDILADEISGRIPVTRVENWQDFDALVTNHFFNRPDVDMVYRGQRRHDWELAPSLGRLAKNRIVTEELAQRQLTLFRKAIRGRVTDHSLLDAGPEDDELWSIGQHHGLMTPLLDWTYSPYVGLFFAFAKEDENAEKDNPYRAVFVLNKTFIADDDKCPDIRVFEPRKDDHGRLVSQAGLFTFSPYGATIESKLLDYLVSDEFDDEELKNAVEEDQPGIIAKYICKIYVKNEGQQDCLNHLKRMNVHHGSLFPDLMGAAEYCNLTLTNAERSRQLGRNSGLFDLLFKIRSSDKDSMAKVTRSEDVLDVGDISSIKELLSTPKLGKKVNEEQLQFIAQELTRSLMKSAALVDWQKRESVTSEIKNNTRVMLRKYGYPIEAREFIENNIIEVLANGKKS